MGDSAADLGRIVGKYEILSQLAEGSVTALFIAKADIGNEAVGLEQLVKSVRGDAEWGRLFLEEARLTAKLVHPNVIRVLELGVDKKRGDPYRVLELVSGQSLAMLMKTVTGKGFSLPLPVACRIVHDACLGLHAAHAAGQLHGSLTPQCIKLTHQGEVKLTDFGLSGLRRALRGAHPGQAFGTLSYIAPEQVLENPVDARTDVFAMATILWELITGRRMHENEAAAPRAVVIERPQAPSTLAGDIPQRLDALVLEGLEKNPEQRQESAGALARALAAATPLAPHAEVATLMETLFADRRRAFEAQLKRLTADAPEEITATGLADEPTKQMMALSDEAPGPTQQSNVFGFPPAPRPSRSAPPANVFEGLPPAPRPARAPVANVFEGLPLAPPPARVPAPSGPRAPANVFEGLPLAPPPARAPAPSGPRAPANVFEGLPPAPPPARAPVANVFDALPPAPPPRPQPRELPPAPAPRAEASVVLEEPPPAPPPARAPAPSAPKSEPARPAPAPTLTIEAARPSAFMLAYDRFRWVLALSLLATAIGVCATWWIKNPPPRPKPPPVQALD